MTNKKLKIKKMLLYHLENELIYAKNNFDDEQISNLEQAIKLVKKIGEN